MTLKEIMTWSDGYTDEVLTEAMALGFANRTIAVINTNFNLELPFITDVDVDYTALNDNWFVRFMIATLSYGIKMNDGSITEAQEYKNDLEVAMYDFEATDKTVVVGEDYVGDGPYTVEQIDTSYAIDIGWFGDADSDWTGW